MYFVEAMQDYIDITDKYSLDLMKIDAYIESVMSELDINMQRSELKVLTESGTDDDLSYLYEAAEEGAIVKIKKAVVAVVEAFKKFISDLKDRVVRIIVTKTTRDTLSKVEKKVKLNPFIAKKKVKITDKKKALSVINKYKSACDKDIAKVKAGIFAEKDIQSIFKDRDNFDSDYKKAISGAAALTTVTVAQLCKMINDELNSLPNVITKIGKETSDAVEKLCDGLKDEEAATSTRVAYTACANLRSKLGKAEANEYVDSIMEGMSILKTEVAKVKGNIEADVAKESVDIDHQIDSLFEEGYDSEALLSELEDLL